MKSFLRISGFLLLQFLLIQITAVAQGPDSWTQKVAFGGIGRNSAVGFALNGKGYIGTGTDGTNIFSDFWEYDPQSDTWSQKADYGGGGRHGGYSFVIGNKAYVGGGVATGSQQNIFYEYDVAANIWTQKANCPNGAFKAIGMSAGGKGYVASGISNPYSLTSFNNIGRKDNAAFSMYDPATDTWTSYPLLPQSTMGPFGFSLNGKIYVGGGQSSSNSIQYKTFSEFDPLTNTWTAKANFPGTRSFVSPTFVLGNKGYVALAGSVGNASELYEYDPSNDSWSLRASYPAGNTVGGVGFSINNTGYIGTGSFTNTFYKYLPSNADVTNPVITCPSNLSLNLDGSCNGLLPDFTSLVIATDNVTPAYSLTITQSPAAGTVVNGKGSLNVIFTVTDEANNRSSCTISVDKKDVTPPVLNCTANITVNNQINPCGGAVVSFAKPTATDNCGMVPFTSFRGGEPNQFQGGIQDYLQLYTDGTWDDLQNTVLNKWIVEFNTIITTNFPGYTRIGEFGGHTYYVSTGTATWINARASAQSIGGDLVSINTSAENSFVAPSGIAWVGGYQDLSDPKYIEPGNASQNFGGWKWVDGTSMSTPIITITQIDGLLSGSVFPVGKHTVTWQAEDESGNKSTCSFTVTVKDVTPPVITCTAPITVNNTANTCGAVVTFTSPTATDNCGIVPFTSFNGGEPNQFLGGLQDYLQLYTNGTWDDLENTVLSKWIVEFNTIITTSFPGYTRIGELGGHTYYVSTSTATWINARKSARSIGGDLVSINTSAENSFVAPSGIAWVGGYQDLSDPKYIEPGNASQNYGGWKWVDGTNMSTPKITITQTGGLSSGAVYPVGVTTNTFTATDESGNTSTCSFTVTVKDVQPPVIICPANQTLNLDASCNATLPDYRNLLTASDNCTASNNLIITQSPAAGTVVNGKGSLIVTFTVTDASNNSSTCTITVNKVDVTAPIMACTASITVNNAANTCGAVVNYINPTATDNCSGAAFNFWNPGEPNNYPNGFNVGEDYVQLYNNATWNDLPDYVLNKSIVEFNSILATNFANYTLIGNFGGHTYYVSTGTATWLNSRTAAQAIGGDLASINTLAESQYLAPYGGNTWVGGYQDKTVPGFSEPGNASQNFLGWKWVDGTQLGGGQIVISQTAGLPSGSVFPVGVTTNIFTATDESGNASTCSFTVTVNDVTPPVIACPANISVNATSAAGALVTYSAPVGTDNCSGATTVRTSGLASGATFPIGVTTVTHEVTDGSGNKAQCSFTVTVSGLAPQINCPANISVNNTVGQCGANVSFAATETIGIPASTITYSKAPGSFFNVGTTTVTATATNAVGTSTCSFTVTIVDNELPVLLGVPANATVECNAVPAAATVTATDNCSTSVPSYTETRTNGNNANNYTLTRTWSTTDASGNTSTATQTITVQDTQNPVISCPFDKIVNAEPGQCSATVNFTVTATDNCGTPVITYSKAPGTVFNLGSTTVIATATDAAGNQSSCSFKVIVVDNQPPIVITKPITVYLNASGQASISPADVDNGSNDNCGPVTLSFQNSGTICATANEGQNLTLSAPQGTVITGITFASYGTPNGGCGNFTLGGCHASNSKTIVQNYALGQNSVTIPATNGVFGDPCGGTYKRLYVEATYAGGSPTSTSFDCSKLGNNTVTLKVADANGNVSTGSAVVTVRDNIAPVITCPGNINTIATSAAGATVTYATPVGADNCTATTTRTAGLASGATFPIGVTTVTYQVTDASGNSAQCSFTVTVTGLAPQISCPGTITVNNTPGQCGANVGFAATETTAIPASTITYSIAPGSFFSVGTTTVTATATNAVGTSSCTFTVTVIDNQFPVLVGIPANATVECDAVPAAAIVTATDNCSTSAPTYTEVRTDGNCPNNYILTRTWSSSNVCI